MVWFYRRSDADLRVETRFDSSTAEYVLEVAWPGRPVMTERFGDTAAFETRVLALERQLDEEQWQQVGSPEILPHGWRPGRATSPPPFSARMASERTDDTETQKCLSV